ncbi:MAG: phosphomannomutase/phosphoglucomutase [Pseudohongiellaceae bacterium]
MIATSSQASGFYNSHIPPNIFRAYDIRGIVDTELSAEVVELIAEAIGGEALDHGIDSLLVGYDGRLSSPALCEALISGIRRSGCNVIQLGMVPTPVLYFATHHSEFDSGVMLTASHNPANYNGIKIVFHQTCLAENQIQAIRQRVERSLQRDSENLQRHDKNSQRLDKNSPDSLNITSHYIQRIVSDINLHRPLKVVIDCGNAVPGNIAPQLFQSLGCEVTPLFCEIDGHFPNHHPDPTVPDNLLKLAARVKQQQADLGLAFDGDGDRLGVVDEQGQFVNADHIIAVLLCQIAPDYPGEPVVFDVKCSRNLARLITDKGMKPVMHNSGHSLMKQKMQETGAPLGGEFAAHLFIKDRWYGFDDGLYAAARLLEILSQQAKPASALFSILPPSVNTPELKLPVSDQHKHTLMQQLIAHADKLEAEELITIDGIRAEFADGWGLIRASNTSPALLLRFEADTLRALHHIQARFQSLLSETDKTLGQTLAQVLA